MQRGRASRSTPQPSAYSVHGRAEGAAGRDGGAGEAAMIPKMRDLMLYVAFVIVVGAAVVAFLFWALAP
jgi:hypothetical protein